MAWKPGPSGSWQIFTWESGVGKFLAACFWIFVILMIIGALAG